MYIWGRIFGTPWIFISSSSKISFDKMDKTTDQIRWIPLESNPETFNQLTSLLFLTPVSSTDAVTSVNTRLPKLEWADVYTLDEEGMNSLCLPPDKLRALVFLFDCRQADLLVEDSKDQARCFISSGSINDGKQEPIWYTKQTISNACGTTAVVHALLNQSDIFPKNDTACCLLHEYYLKSREMSWEERASALGMLANVHQQCAEIGEAVEDELPDLHYVCFIVGKIPGSDDDSKLGLWELDGRKAGPIYHGECEKNDLMKKASDLIQKKWVSKLEGVSFSMLGMYSTE
jgi:ubiquitin carboxyl-terminal hydrolase L3